MLVYQVRMDVTIPDGSHLVEDAARKPNQYDNKDNLQGAQLQDHLQSLTQAHKLALYLGHQMHEFIGDQLTANTPVEGRRRPFMQGKPMRQAGPLNRHTLARDHTPYDILCTRLTPSKAALDTVSITDRLETPTISLPSLVMSTSSRAIPYKVGERT